MLRIQDGEPLEGVYYFSIDTKGVMRMDMSNNPTPAILHRFYGMVGAEVIILVLLALILWKLGVWRRWQSLPKSPTNRVRNYFRYGLGALWLLDGLLQLQPAMSSDFVPGGLVPLLNGQPFWYSQLLEWGIVRWASHPILSDSLVAILQMLLGIFILFPGNAKFERAVLKLSIAWGLVVWILGEALAQMLVQGYGSWFNGAPGSVVFYIVGAIFLLVPIERWESGRVRHWIWNGIGGLWLAMSIFQLLPWEGYWTGSALSQVTLNMAQMAQPQIFSTPLYMTARFMDHHAVSVNLLCIVVMLVAGLGMILKKRWALWVAVIWTLLTWWLAQDFGVLGGLGTDPQSGALVLLYIGVGILMPLGMQRPATGSSTSDSKIPLRAVVNQQQDVD